MLAMADVETLRNQHLDRLSACRRCTDLLQPEVRPVLSRAAMPRVMLVGQAPGDKEPKLGRPFAWTAGKTLFRGFDPECFEAYLQHGLQPVGDRLRLRFDPATEISIYRGVPHTSPGRARMLKVPLAVVRARAWFSMAPAGEPLTTARASATAPLTCPDTLTCGWWKSGISACATTCRRGAP